MKEWYSFTPFIVLSEYTGAESMSKPIDFPHDDRYGGVKDFAGNIWWMVTHQKNNNIL